MAQQPNTASTTTYSGTLELNLPNKAQFAQFQREKLETASIWFAQRFPEAADKHGAPFVEIRESSCDGFTRVTPISINIDFFAASLKGDPELGHQVVYFEPEMQFYYYEPVLQLYKPTTAEKLQNLFRAMLMRCAKELPGENSKLNLCCEFRSDKVARSVVNRSKSVLAASADFFSATSPHTRIRGIELHERIARKFVDGLLTCEPGEILLLKDAYDMFCGMIKQQSLEPVKRSEFSAMVVPLIREQFNVALRNDLVIDERQGVRGWKDMKLLTQADPE